MRKIYLKILIFCVILLWIVYFIQSINESNKEPFVPRLKEFYRPCIRNMTQSYEQFMNNYGPDVVMLKLKKWNIY
jgi:hypothetical protein